MSQPNDMIRLLQIAYSWRKPILIVTFLMAVASSLLSWFGMPDYYKSSVILYPSNPIMNDRQVLFSKSAGEIEIDYFGSAGDVDRILTLAYTSDIVDYIINKFGLIQHYGYDSTKTLARYNTKKKFLKNYSAMETEHGAIEIAVWDQDKDLAVKMVNEMVQAIDDHNKDMILRDKRLVIQTFKSQVAQKEKYVTQLQDSILHLPASTPSETKLILDAKLTAAVTDLTETKQILDQNVLSATTDFSTVHITEAAYPAIRKDKPKRSIIVIGATLGTFFFMLILAVISTNYKRLKSQIRNG